MTPFGPTIRRLLLEPAMLLFGAATFASLFAMQMPDLAGLDNAELWAGLGALVWGIVAIWLGWWTPRQLVGPAVGVGRFWKWLGYSIGLGILSALPLLIVGFIAGFGQDEQLIDWRGAVASMVLQAALMLMWVRVYAVAISGDRVLFAHIRDALSGRVFELLLFFAPAISISWAGSMMLQVPALVDGIDAFALAGLSAAVQALATCLMTATMVAAYLAVDRSSDIDGARDVFS